MQGALNDHETQTVASSTCPPPMPIGPVHGQPASANRRQHEVEPDELWLIIMSEHGVPS